jgi:hypothetical protein
LTIFFVDNFFLSNGKNICFYDFFKKQNSLVDGVGGGRAVGGADAVGSGHGCVPARV